MLRCTIPIAGAILALSGCVSPGIPSICELGEGEVVIFPDAVRDVPTNAAVRVVVAGRGEDYEVALFDEDRDAPVPGTVTQLATSYGDVLELVPDALLPPDTTYAVDVFDLRGARVADTVFWTGAFTEDGPPSDPGRVDIAPLTARERACCSGRACKDGTALEVPAPEAFAPQLVLVEVEEVFNDRCGPNARLVAVVPVVYDGHATRLFAETDAILDGCFRVTLVDQALRAGAPDDVVCTPGYDWVPAPVDPDCRPRGGCSCRAGAPLGDAAGAVAGLALIAWMVARSRRIRGSR